MKKIKYKVFNEEFIYISYNSYRYEVYNYKDEYLPDYLFYIKDEAFFYLRVFTNFLKIYNNEKNKIIIPIKDLTHKWYKNDFIDKIKM